VIATSRLILRPFEPQDLDALAVLMEESEVMSWLGGTKTRAETADWLDRQMRSHGRHGFSRLAVVERRSGQLVGRCGPSCLVVGGRDEVELGWAIARDRWGQGLATEAGGAVRDHCLGELGLERLVSLVLPSNPRSVRVAVKLGARHERDVEWAGEPHRLYVHRSLDRSELARPSAAGR
jgi:RimJ/RimL family protein N-acetyltransferase